MCVVETGRISRKYQDLTSSYEIFMRNTQESSQNLLDTQYEEEQAAEGCADNKTRSIRQDQ